MKSRILALAPSPSMAVAMVALIAAVAGTGYAASQIDSRDVENNSLKSRDLKNKRAVKSKDVVNDQLQSVDVADGSLLGVDLDDNTVTGANIDEASVGPVDGDVRFLFNLAFGESRQVAQIGALTLTASCVQNTTDNAGNANRDVARITISTSENGSVFVSNQDDKDGSAAAQFLNTNTPASDAIVIEASAPTGTAVLEDNEDVFAAAPGGTRISVPNEAGNPTVNLFGANCGFTGEVENLG